MARLDLIDWNAVALEVVKTIQVRVYAEPRLAKGAGTRTAEGRRAPDAEYRRRKGTRELNEELSQYYQLAANKRVWKCPKLLSMGKHDREHSE